ncbi:MAG: ABC transporter substrate-binding protein [Anaerolineae bacterium]
MKRFVVAFAALLIVVFAAAACSSSAPSTPAQQQPAPPAAQASQAPAQAPAAQATAPAAAKAAEAPKAAAKGGQIVEVRFADAKTLNSALVNDTSSGDTLALMGNGLVWINPKDLLPMPQLATKWDISPDGKTYTFTLRDDVKFHDGQKFTADDVKFTYELMLNEKVNSPRRTDLSVIDSITVKSPTEIEFKLKNVKADFLANNASYQIMPKHVLEKLSPEQINTADFNTKSPVYTGAFKFKEWVKDDHITLEANPDYFLGKPAVDQYVLKVVKDGNVVAAQLKTGESDFGFYEAPLLSEMQKQDNLNNQAFDTFNFTFYTLNLDKDKTTLFQDKQVRQALLYGLDRDAMVKSIMFGQGSVANASQPVLSWAYNADNTPKYPYDPKKAEELLDAAGWKKGADGIREKDGKKMSFQCWTNAGNKVRESYVTVMQEQWKQIGVEMTPKLEEWNAFLDRLTKTHDFDCFLVGFAWGVDPNQRTMFHTDSYKGGFNMAKYSNPDLDKILDDALLTTDVQKRKDLYFKAQQIVAEDLPVTILDFPKNLGAVNKKVTGLAPNAANYRFEAQKWGLASQ